MAPMIGTTAIANIIATLPFGSLKKRRKKPRMTWLPLWASKMREHPCATIDSILDLPVYSKETGEVVNKSSQNLFKLLGFAADWAGPGRCPGAGASFIATDAGPKAPCRSGRRW